jgi:hypothetical protein
VASDDLTLKNDDELWAEFEALPKVRAAGIRNQAVSNLTKALENTPEGSQEWEVQINASILQLMRDRQRRLVRGETERQMREVMDQERADADSEE